MWKKGPVRLFLHFSRSLSDLILNIALVNKYCIGPGLPHHFVSCIIILGWEGNSGMNLSLLGHGLLMVSGSVWWAP